MVTKNHADPKEVLTGTAAKPIRGSNKWLAHVLTFLMVFGPGLIMREADRDAGAVSTYVQAGAQFTPRMHLFRRLKNWFAPRE
jgi:Mn2+/Fe2+ NRAMP family transporter